MSDGVLDYFTDNASVLWKVPVAVAVLALLRCSAWRSHRSRTAGSWRAPE
ncbi:MAG: hypothetical protein R2705_08110 [Ilumatobacteraceae bacterium]